MRATALATLVISVCAAGAARGQTPVPPAPQEPALQAPAPLTPAPQGSAIFGGAEARGLAEHEDRLDLLLQLFGGYDDDVLADSSGSSTSQPRLASAAAGLATGLGAALTYSNPGLLINRPSGKGDFRAFIDSSIRFYPALDNLTGTYHRFGLQLSAPVSRSVTFFFAPRADYSPRYAFELLGPLPLDPESSQGSAPGTGETTPGAVDYSVVSSNSFRYGASGAAEIKTGRRSTLTFDGAYMRRTADVSTYDMAVQNAGVSFDYRVTSNASLDLGYGYEDGNHGSGLTTKAHHIDVGVNYRRPLSRTRRTFVTFDTGTTVAESEVTGRRVHAIGSASLVHYFKRTWTAVAEYRRRLQYVDGFDRPLFGDSVTTGFNGLLSRRFELIARANYNSGTVGLSSNAPRFDSYSGSVRLRRAFNRRLAGYAETLFFHYSFEEGARRPPGIPREFDRLAFRCGLSLWVPLMR